MSEQSKPEEEKLLDHEYDGIRELDNPLPRWWLYGFYLTIIFSVFYVGYYHFGPGLSLSEQHARSLAVLEAERAAGAASADSHYSNPELLALSEDADAVATGQELYVASCAACHGAQGEGTIGPNLVDEYWIHGGYPEDIAKVIAEGVPDKGMPAWNSSMSVEDIQMVTAFILSIGGTDPPNAREPEGERFRPE